MKVPKRRLAAALGTGLAAALIGVGVAHADPNVPAGGNAYDRPLHGQGSDTTDLVMNGLAEVVVDGGGNKLIASWDAKSSNGFTTRSPGNTPAGSNCTYGGNPTPNNAAYQIGMRANGSSNGQRAIRDAFTSGTSVFGCLDFARSSSFPSASNLGTVGVNAIPLATDGLTFVRTSASLAPKQLTKAQLQAIYKCSFGNWKNNSNPASATNFKALIPQAGSGTRSSWLGMVGITEQNLTDGLYPCVTDQADLGPRRPESDPNSNPIQEHDSRAVNNFAIGPVSIAQWISQKGGAATDVQGAAVMGTIKSAAASDPTVSYPIVLNSSFGNVGVPADNLAATRTVYNVLPRSIMPGGATPNAQAILAFADTDPDANVNTSLICQRTDILQKFGFAPIATCGSLAFPVN